MASLLYDSGLRCIELVRLRVKDVNFDHLQFQIWNVKGIKHRLTTLAPERLEKIKQQIELVKLYLNDDLLNEKMALYKNQVVNK